MSNVPQTPIQVRIVLVRPYGAANIGSAARVMRNFGLEDLALVMPRTNHLSNEACAMACSAQGILERARIFDSLAQAITNCRWVCGTTARVGERRRAELTPRLTALHAIQSLPAAFVFGPEESGLAAQELNLCHAVVSVPTAPELRSMNLAQAVGLMAYELWTAALESCGGGPAAGAAAAGDAAPAGRAAVQPLGTGRPDRSDRASATAEEIEAALIHLQQMLEAVGYFRQSAPEHPMREIRRFLARAQPTSLELNMIRGVCRKTLNTLEHKEED